MFHPAKLSRHHSRQLLPAPQSGDGAEPQLTSKRLRTSQQTGPFSKRVRINTQADRGSLAITPSETRILNADKGVDDYKFVEVVRGRRARSALIGAECEQCKMVALQLPSVIL